MKTERRALTAVVIIMYCIPAFAEPMTEREASGACMLFIKKSLHDPDSATFENSKESTVFVKDNRAMVIRSVRATNGYGAKRRTEFMCLLEQNDGKVMPIFVAPKGVESKKGEAILKKWKLFS